MMEFICAIPEEIGWAIVGFFACLCLEMFGLLIGKTVQIIKERIEDAKELAELADDGKPSVPSGEFR